MSKRQRDRLIYTLLLIICMVGFWVFENFYSPDSYSSKSDDNFKTPVPSFIIPYSPTGEQVDHDHYSLSYNEAYEQAEWVVYTLKKSHLTYDDRERPDFIEDPYVSSRSADWRNYRGSGYDRGHLCPAGDRRFSELAYRETFYTSNIVPQDSEFNAGIWNEMEKQVRRWSKKYDKIYVATGGILQSGLTTIGEEEVAVPNRFYKIVARGSVDDLQVLGFVFPHKDSSAPLSSFAVSVDRIEALTRIDFFRELPDQQEEKLESEVLLSDWQFTSIH